MNGPLKGRVPHRLKQSAVRLYCPPACRRFATCPRLLLVIIFMKRGEGQVACHRQRVAELNKQRAHTQKVAYAL